MKKSTNSVNVAISEYVTKKSDIGLNIAISENVMKKSANSSHIWMYEELGSDASQGCPLQGEWEVGSGLM